MTRKKNRSGRHNQREIAAAQLGPVQAAIPGSPAAAAVEAAPSQDNEGPDSALETTLQQHGPVASPLSLQLSGGHPLGSEGGVAGHVSEQESEDYSSAKDGSANNSSALCSSGETGTMFDAESMRSETVDSKESPERDCAAEEAPEELPASPKQLTLAPSVASQPLSPDSAAAHPACATDAAVTVSVVIACKKRYTSTELTSYRSSLAPSTDMAASLQGSGVPCHSFASARSLQRPSETCQQKRQVWKWAAWNASQTSSRPAGRTLAHAPSQQRAWGAAAQAPQEAQQQQDYARWRQEFLQHSAVSHSSIASVVLKKTGLLQKRSAPGPTLEGMSQERRAASLQSPGAPQFSRAPREQPRAALAAASPHAEADPCPGVLLQQSMGPHRQLGPAPAIALLAADAGLRPDACPQRWHNAPAASAPPGAEGGLCMDTLLQQGTVLQLQPGAPPAHAPELGTLQRVALQTVQRLAGQDNAGPVQGAGGASTLQTVQGSGGVSTLQMQVAPGCQYRRDGAQAGPSLYCGICSASLEFPVSLLPCGDAFCDICVAVHPACGVTCPVCSCEPVGPREGASGLNEAPAEKQSRMSCAERQGCLERKTVFKREQADAEASCEAPITQLEDADEPLQQPPQRSSQRMCESPQQQDPAQPARSTDTPARSICGTPAPARQLAVARRAPAQRPPLAAFSTVWLSGPVYHMPAAMPPQPHMPFPAHAGARHRLQQPSGPPMPIYPSGFAPLPPGGLLPFPPPWRPAVFYPLVPSGLSRWIPPMYVPSPMW